MFGDFGTMFMDIMVALAAMGTLPLVACICANRLPTDFSRRSFVAFSMGLAGPAFWSIITVQNHFLNRPRPTLVLAEVVFGFALVPLWLGLMLRKARPSRGLNRMLATTGAVGLMITGFGLYKFFSR